MTRVIDVIIEHTNQDLEAIKRMKQQIDNIGTSQNTSFDSRSIRTKYLNSLQTRQLLFTRTQHK